VGLHLAIVTPTRSVVETEAESVLAPGSEGELGILPGHAPLLVALKAGVVRYTEGGRTNRVAIGGGFAEVTQERVIVLAPSAETPDEIDRTEAEQRRAQAESALGQLGSAAPPEQTARARDAVERAQARLDVLR
jgi:F-type H+-transporting ATPase subunit epsilon